MAFVIKVKNIPWIKDKDGYDEGFAFWPFIFITNPGNEKLLYHEKVHIKQQLRGLLVLFYIKYIYYHFKYGYWDNPYEVEARKKADEYMQRKKLYGG